MSQSPLKLDFQEIGNLQWIYCPPEWPIKNDTSSPDTVLFFAWGSAVQKNIVKYTNHYLGLYPKARIILFETPFSDLMLHTPERQAKRLSGVVDVIQSAPGNSKTLIHLFSNGGSYKLLELAKTYRSVTGKIMPVDMIVLDSAPGQPDVSRSIVAFQTQLPRSFLLFYPLTFLLYLYMLFTYLSNKILGVVPVTRYIWEGLNNPMWIDPKAKRLYLFSKTDELINWEDIKLHADVAESKGCKVQTVEFKGSKHVAHVVVGKDQYWNHITSLWNESTDRNI